MPGHAAQTSNQASAVHQKPAPAKGEAGLQTGCCPELISSSPGFSGRPDEILAYQRLVGNRVVQRMLADRPPANGSRPTAWPIHPAGQPANKLQRKEENEKPLGDIQGYAMFGLLPALQNLPVDVRTDEDAGGKVGGPRLVTAMRVVKAKGTPWLDFVTGHNGELASLPQDQIADIMNFLGAPKDARYFKGEEFENKFDGAVDPAQGVVTLFFRVKFQAADGAQFGGAEPGTPGWEKETEEAMQKFKGDFKRVVEQAWSGKGTLKPGIAVGGVKVFKTKVVVSVVDSGEHTVMYVHNDIPGGRSNVDQEEKIGNLKISDNELKTKDKDHPVMDEKGRRAGTVTTEQPTSAHEFGHAIGLSHPSCKHGDDICYGKTKEERESMMGAGNKLSVIQRKGDIKHNDFEPFLKIARRWGQDIFPGALQAKGNNWTAG